MGRLRVDSLCGAPHPLVGPAGSIAVRCYVARGVLARTIGLLGTADLDDEEALWIAPCASVHTIGMRMAIGVAFVDADGVVIKVVERLRPGRIALCRGARGAVEARPSVLAAVRVGDALSMGL